MGKINVTVWNEYLHEQSSDAVKAIYPNGIHNAIGDMLKKNENITVRTATLREEEHGLTDEVLAVTDVLIWWGHMAHHEVRDDIVQKVYRRVMDGMGLIVLHSGHASKIFHKLLGTDTGTLKWREIGELERLWVIDPTHPIVKGVKEFIEIPHEEMYGEMFSIPTPDELIFISWFAGGEVFRSGVTYKRGLGKIFYFRPGHETYPVYYQKEVQRVIENAVFWAYTEKAVKFVSGFYTSIEDYKKNEGI